MLSFDEMYNAIIDVNFDNWGTIEGWNNYIALDEIKDGDYEGMKKLYDKVVLNRK